VDLTHDVIGELLASGVTPDSIPLSADVTPEDLAELLKDDTEPLQVVARIAPGAGGRPGWQYTSKAIEQLATTVARTSLPGYLGHEHGSKPPQQWPFPVIHWVGAKWDGSAALLRGVVDRSQAEIKRLLRSHRISHTEHPDCASHSAARRAELRPGGSLSVGDHLAAADPHGQYLTAPEADAAYLDQSKGDARYLPLTGGNVTGSLASTGSVSPGNGGVAGPAVWGGAGVPSSLLGVDGDFFFRRDTPTVALQRIYVKSGGVWTGLL
jgi:hypothetical protein